MKALIIERDNLKNNIKVIRQIISKNDKDDKG